jgi:hypothetical protein
LTYDGAKQILDQLVAFYVKLVEQGPIFATVENIAEMLNTYKLAPQFLKGYLQRIA